MDEPVPPSSDFTSEILRAQINSLYQHVPMVLLVNLVNAALVAAALGSYLGDSRWWLFFGLVAILTAARGFLWVRYRAAQFGSIDPRRWARIATIASLLSGMLWGGASALLFPHEAIGQTFVAFVIGGMCAGALASLSYHLPAFFGYVVPATLPLAARFLFEGGPVNATMSALVAVFMVALTFAAYNVARSFRLGFKLQFELHHRTDALSAANARLEAEISQRQSAENQLRQTQKMDALGQLTGGIAHDFNNLLTAVIGHIELALVGVRDDTRTAGLLRGALAAAERGATLTQRLLAFARRQHLEPRPVDVPATVGEVEKLLKQTIGPAIRLIVQSEPGICPANVDPDQLAVAILNLALNARDAMPAGGTLHISSARRWVEPGAMPQLAPGEYVVVSVSDTGMGMNEETAARAFEPFFTTKEVGRGSGLGLPMVQGFAAQSGGAIDIETAVGRGTKVELWLPRADHLPDRDRPKRTKVESGCARARILVCDDDAEVRAFVGAALRDHGHTVWEANDPSAALKILEREPIDLLLADYAMPDMTGAEMIKQARGCHPRLKALLMTGHGEGLLSGGSAGVPLLPKPFNVAELNDRVIQTLLPASAGNGGRAQ
jgi:signal transduction histidine kinase/CheY-like chemotaxis protein